ncbi:retropepsin-like aspartic protease family protein [Parathermosynechococcus lividus]
MICWQRQIYRLGLSGSVLGLLLATSAQALPLPEHFYRAIANQDWGSAIAILDQVIQANPQQASALRSYRQELVRLQHLPRSAALGHTAVMTSPSGIAPIVRRQNGIPVIQVTFNRRLRFEMMVDSGASMTVITRPMARALGITPAQVIDNLTFHTANGTVVLPIVYVQSISVAGLHRNRVPVAIAGAEMPLGLLGQDFLQNYDVSLRQDHIYFQRR